jgi:hypothetical protein
MENPGTSELNHLTLTVDAESIIYLEETRKWASFLAIIGFIGVAFLLLAGIFFTSIMSMFAATLPAVIPGFFGMIYVLIALLYFFPCLYLYRFSTQMKKALHQTDQEKLTSSFGNLKSLFRFMGLCTVVVLSIYLIILLTVVIFGLMR